MSGRKQYRVVVHRVRDVGTDYDYLVDVAWSPRKNFTSKAAATRYAERFGPEPWRAFGLGPEDHWCEGGSTMRGECGKEKSGDPFDPPYLCAHPNRTCREAFSGGVLGTVERVEIQERTVSPWSTVSIIHQKEPSR